MAGIEVIVAEDPAGAATLAAGELARAITGAVAARGRAAIAVSGGTTPAAMLADLAVRPLPWDRVHVLQVDERVAPPGDPARNLGQLRAALLERAPIPPGNVHPMPVEARDLDAAAAAYAATLAALAPDGLDAVHLGIGDDGHTASLTPGSAALDVRDRLVALGGPYRGHERMTLTYPALDAARRVVFLAAGAGKAGVVARLAAGDPGIPAGRVDQARAVLVCDREAAAGIP